MSDRRSLLRRLDQTGIPLIVARLVLGVLFIKMGLTKAADPVDFLKLIRQYEMVPETGWWFLNFTAIVLPWAEVFCGVLLIAGVAVRGASLTLLIMLLVFTPVVALRAVDIYGAGDLPFCGIAFDCGCGSGVVNICFKLFENVGLALLCLLALVSQSRRLCFRSRLIPSRSPASGPSR